MGMTNRGAGGGNYDEVERRGKRSKSGGGDSAERTPVKRQKGKETVKRQIESGRQTLLRTVGRRYEMDDGRYGKRRREGEAEGESAMRMSRRRMEGTEYDDGG